MKKYSIASALTIALTLILSLSASAQIWTEDFNDAAIDGKGNDGGIIDVAGVTNWTIDTSGATIEAGDWFKVDTQRFEGQDLDGEAIWYSKVIDITGGDVGFSLEAIENGDHESGDYFDVAYSVDGGAYTVITNWNGKGDGTHTLIGDIPDDGDWLAETVSVYGISGTGLQVRVSMLNNSGTEQLRLDNVVVSAGGPPTNLPPNIVSIDPQSVVENNTLTFPVIANDSTDNDVITLSASNLPAGATFVGATNATQASNDFIWVNASPAGIYTTTFYAVDKDGVTSNDVLITVVEAVTNQLFISEVADPGDNFDARFVELYNAGAAPIDLTNDSWYISKQTGGSGTWYDEPLTGTVAAGSTYVICNNYSDFLTAYGKSADQAESSIITGNGNDPYFLYKGGDHSTGQLADAYGEIDVDGTGEAWEYEDSRAERTNTVTGPNPSWTASEWSITAANVADMTPGIHGDVSDLPPTLTPVDDQVVEVNDTLTFTAFASDAVDGDAVTIWATDLPGTATFTSNSNPGSVTGTFNWASASPIGVYTSTFWAADKDGTVSDTAVIEVIAETPDIIISEIMQNPSAVSDGDGEWFELYNNESIAVDIDGWTITDDGDSNVHTIDNGGPLTIAANSFLVLGIETNVLSNGNVNVDYQYTGVTLGNGSDSLIIENTNGVQITRVAWDDGATYPDPAGASMYLKGPALDPEAGANWGTSGTAWPGSAGDLGTPGAANDEGTWGGGSGFTDTDGDGMSDEYELTIFGDATSSNDWTGDLDGDGYINGEEFLADTDADNIADFYENMITNPPVVGAVMNLLAGPPTSTNRLYDAYWTTNLLDSSGWNGIGLNVEGDPAGGAVTLTVTNDAEGRFYRTGVKLK
jgi:hypothetical protein